MKTLCIFLFSLCLSNNSYAGSDLNKVASSLYCHELPPENAKPAEVLGYSAFLIPEPVNFFGNSDKAAIFPDESGKIIAGSILVDEHDPKSKHKHIRKIYKRLVKNEGTPVDVKNEWIWEVVGTDISMISIDILREGSAVTFICR